MVIQWQVLRDHHLVRHEVSVLWANRPVSANIDYASFVLQLLTPCPSRPLWGCSARSEERDRPDRNGCGTLLEIGNGLMSQKLIEEGPWKLKNSGMRA